MSLPDQVRTALNDGPFGHAFACAAAHRGLSLRQLRHRLAARDVALSAVTLSYWQTGRSLPEREESLHAVTVLEEILELPKGALLACLGAKRPRGRGVPSCRGARRLHRAWDYPAFLPPLLREFDSAALDSVYRVGLHDTVYLDADRRLSRIVVRMLVEARRDAAKTVLTTSRSGRGLEPPSVLLARRCRVATAKALPEEGFALTELAFDRALDVGGRAVVEYTEDYSSRAVATHHHRRIAERIRDYRVSVVFHRDAPPRSCATWRTRFPDGRRLGLAPVPVGEDATVVVLAGAVAPGIHGLSWAWE
ncbi:hypothetical protein ACFWY9_27300 [Amycolatopsis sp. NPDC059027]|uniref:hypothetical protein n=1 Tax=Amycolatopsis sp. NPDC059027 TaxID=3346709 RepID=UPI0036714DE5